jgi:hypothetical protein
MQRSSAFPAAPSSSGRALLAAIASGALLAAACRGGAASVARDGSSSVASGEADGYDLGAAAGRASFPMKAPADVAAETRLARLSHDQYQHTVQDLFGIRESLDLTLSPDALNGFAYDTSSAFRVDARLGPQYRLAAEALAERAVRDGAIFARIVPCPVTGAGCRDEFLQRFGERAFRRPLTASDLDSFRQLFDAAVARSPGASPEASFAQGVRLTLEAMLQAPEFLYRIESVGTLGADGRIHLDDFDVAARLSYFLYDSMPDEALLVEARAGRLHTAEQLEAATRRMLGEPRVLDKLVSFHDQVWEVEKFGRISADASAFPNLPRALGRRVRQATLLFIRDVLQSGGGLTELLTAPYAYVDDALASVYGLPPSALPPAAAPGGFRRVSFDPSQRQGLLMQVGYLASNAYSRSTDPIHRGLFVIRNLLCREIPDPPPGATTTPPPPTTRPIVTTRDEVSLVTGQSFCPTCHREINAAGFAFEGFDALGQRRSLDNGAAVDTQTTLVLDDEPVDVPGPSELVERIARSREAHRCYTSRWLEFAYGRPLAKSDLPTLDAIAAESRPIADIIVAIVLSPAFTSRAPVAPAPRAAQDLAGGALSSQRGSE